MSSGSGSSSGRTVGYQVRGPGFESQSRPSQLYSALLYPPSCKWVARSLSTSAKVKAARKGIANYLIMPHAKNNQDPTTGSLMFGLSVGPTLLLFPIQTKFI
ncbi:hypothetical protein PoB_006871400 [Plakobranchus ocellatus]|uniref:Uncharacterized protein n=1 Tax=Plakobranchus ocellatus TaxID=259542 RepID=A0AAV4DDL1_9GAST|nr:hypothetical protein PoB_006871400 [Plakobranchus ocellatus]